MDNLSQQERSRLMRAVRRQNSSPELLVRRAAHALGLRFRLHRKDLPGTPDLVFPKYKTCVFVHGCFWHRHSDCPKTTTPKSNVVFWTSKFRSNMARDERCRKELFRLGWRVVVIWECEAKEPATLRRRLRKAFRRRRKRDNGRGIS